jgi:hypothetical protein
LLRERAGEVDVEALRVRDLVALGDADLEADAAALRASAAMAVIVAASLNATS